MIHLRCLLAGLACRRCLRRGDCPRGRALAVAWTTVRAGVRLWRDAWRGPRA